MAYRPAWFEEFSQRHSVLDMALEVHGFLSGSSDTTYADKYYRCLQHALDTWTESTPHCKEFDDIVKQLLVQVTTEYVKWKKESPDVYE